MVHATSYGSNETAATTSYHSINNAATTSYHSINDNSHNNNDNIQSPSALSSRPSSPNASSANGTSSPANDTPNASSSAKSSLDAVLDKLSLSQLASVSLENKGSVARDHMANERTFLAWLRTSLSFITIGIGVTQLFRLENNPVTLAKPLGLVFIALGILTLLWGTVRYFHVQSMMIGNHFPASRLGVLALIVIVGLVVLSTFVVILLTS